MSEEQDRREWIAGVARRLGLVAEVHRCRVECSTPGPAWAWSCLRPGCGEFRVYYPSQPGAFAGALAHAQAFIPGPPEENPVTELDLLAFDALWTNSRAGQDAFAAALPGRMEAVARQLNEWAPAWFRFEWRPAGE